MELIAGGIIFIFTGIIAIITGILHYSDIILIVLILFVGINYIGRKIIKRRNEKEFYEAQQEAAELEEELEYMAKEYDWSKEP